MNLKTLLSLSPLLLALLAWGTSIEVRLRGTVSIENLSSKIDRVEDHLVSRIDRTEDMMRPLLVEYKVAKIMEDQKKRNTRPDPKAASAEGEKWAKAQMRQEK
jgi:hypothetical protein